MPRKYTRTTPTARKMGNWLNYSSSSRSTDNKLANDLYLSIVIIHYNDDFKNQDCDCCCHLFNIDRMSSISGIFPLLMSVFVSSLLSLVKIFSKFLYASFYIIVSSSLFSRYIFIKFSSTSWNLKQ